MNTYAALAALAVIGLIGLAASNARASGLAVDDPAALARTQSLGQLIVQTPDHPVHILFVHGMRAEGPGTAQYFMAGLCRYGPVTCPPQSGDFKPSSRLYFDLGPPPSAEIMGQAVWRTPADWAASRPFVDRYVFDRGTAPPVIVDEVNWWPLLFPLKCRFLVAPEARLSGIDRTHLELCYCGKAPFHQWLSDQEYQDALKGPVISGGGAWANAAIKQQVLNWGLADVAIALGPMRSYFRLAIDKAFEYAATFGEHDVDHQAFVVVSESLGSFVVMDAGTNPIQDSPNAIRVVANTSNLYFFANQFALLDLGRISGLPRVSASPAMAAALAQPPAAQHPVGQPAIRPPGAADLSAFEMLRSWAGPKPSETAVAPPKAKQIIAFNDPSDALTFDVPPLPPATVVNIYGPNEGSFLGLLVNPITAHTGYSQNPAVLKQMFAH